MWLLCVFIYVYCEKEWRGFEDKELGCTANDEVVFLSLVHGVIRRHMEATVFVSIAILEHTFGHCKAGDCRISSPYISLL
jgi:hypothetical protein